MKYYNYITVEKSFDETVNDVKEALKNEGFGILSEINMQEKFKEKLDVDFRKYLILGACNPSYAHKAVNVEDKIGLMLPCNVVVQEKEKDFVEVSVIEPVVSMSGIKNKDLLLIAGELNKKLMMSLLAVKLK
ncbi:DUF302 domain-containing protein [Carboxylicivirga sediminis]|uniref:DUF302 domain-containing protein n=1 Tax=Carboxylicivirga sediminis TaxID=2006564 RepID=A0A941F5B1_9BACT|nr:DUF302 domain-containing protein [Carboxylicivirga sediminis]MBR8536722.1 DUF302 domain-containing protein [Carboxylicivirga sediminis]